VAHNALAYAMNDEFSRVLHQQMEYFSSNPNADTLTRVRGEMNEASASFLLFMNLSLGFLQVFHRGYLVNGNIC